MDSHLRSIFSRRMLIVLLMGFASGLPLMLIGSTLKAWLREDGVDLTTIGFFSLAGLPYTVKFLWSPLMDRFAPAGLGRRRGWLLLCQVALAAGFVGIALSDPAGSLGALAVLCVLVGFFSASQDVAADAYRREILSDAELGFGSSLFINGYRLAMYVSGALALILAGLVSWTVTYVAMAALMGIGMATTLLAPEPVVPDTPPTTLAEAVIGPFRDFLGRPGAALILAFILLYKLGDAMAAEMLNPFYLDVGFSLEEIGAVGKTVGLVGTLGGALVGGLIMLWIGIHRSLWIFGALQAISTASFLMLASSGPVLSTLALVVGIETVSAGMGMAAYVAYMASITNRRFTATQYALLTSIMGIPRVIFGATTGLLAEGLGWPGFFLFCTAIAAPGLLLLAWVAPWHVEPDPESVSGRGAGRGRGPGCGPARGS